MFDLRQIVLLVFATLVGVGAGVLAYLADPTVAQAVAIGVGAFAVSLAWFNKVVV